MSVVLVVFMVFVVRFVSVRVMMSDVVLPRLIVAVVPTRTAFESMLFTLTRQLRLPFVFGLFPAFQERHQAAVQLDGLQPG